MANDSNYLNILVGKLKIFDKFKTTILGMDYMVKFLECKLSYLNNYSFY